MFPGTLTRTGVLGDIKQHSEDVKVLKGQAEILVVCWKPARSFLWHSCATASVTVAAFIRFAWFRYWPLLAHPLKSFLHVLNRTDVRRPTFTPVHGQRFTRFSRFVHADLFLLNDDDEKSPCRCRLCP